MSRFVDRKDVLSVIADEDHGAMPAHDAETLLAHAESYRLTPELLLSLATGPDRPAAGTPRDDQGAGAGGPAPAVIPPGPAGQWQYPSPVWGPGPVPRRKCWTG